MKSRRKAKIAAGVISLLLPFLAVNASPSEKPEIVRCDARYLDTVVHINVQWQSSNPVTVVRAIVGKAQREVKVDEYDNKRNPDGYSGEATIVVDAAPGMMQEGIPYLVQIEDELRQKSEKVTGSIRTGTASAGGPAGGAAYGGYPPGGGYPGGGAFGGAGYGGGTPPGGAWPGGGTGSGGGMGQGGGFPGSFGRPGTGTPGGGTWSGGVNWPGGGVSVGAGMTAGGGGRPGTGVPGGTVPGGGTQAGYGSPGGVPAPGGGSQPGTGSSAAPRILQNDGFNPGGRVAFIDGLKAGDEVAFVLGPVDRPFQVTKIAFLCGGSTGTGILTMKISQDTGGSAAGAPLFSESYQLQGADTAFQEIDLAGQIGIFPAGSIRVSFQAQHAGLPAIGHDASGSAVPQRNWISRSGAPIEFGSAGIPGNGIVRATVVTQ